MDRREFFLGTTAVTLAATALKAQTQLGLVGGGATSPVGRPPIQMGITANNTDGFGPTSGAYTYIDLIKESSPLYDANAGQARIEPTLFDANGWPTSMGSHTNISTLLTIPPKSGKPHNYKVIVTDICTFTIGTESGTRGPFTTSAGLNVLDVDLGQITYEFRATVSISAIGSPYCKQIAIVYLDEYDAWQGGAVFQPDTIAKYSVLKTLRYMDMQRTNGSIVQSISDSCPLAYRSYSNSWWDPTKLAANQFIRSGGDISLYTQVNSSYVLADCQRVVQSFDHASYPFGTFTASVPTTFGGNPATQLTFSNPLTGIAAGMKIQTGSFRDDNGTGVGFGYTLAGVFAYRYLTVLSVSGGGTTVIVNLNTAAWSAYNLIPEIVGGVPVYPEAYLVCYLNINSTGAKPLIMMTGFACNSTYFFAWSAGALMSVRYSPMFDAYVVGYGGENYGFPPIENLVRLANETGCNPWFCIPGFALDAPGNNPVYTDLTDYQHGLYTYVDAHLDSSLTAKFEPANEVWNAFVPEIYNTCRIAWLKNAARSPPGTDARLVIFGNLIWMGYAASLAGQCAMNAFGYNIGNCKSQTRYQVIIGMPVGGGLEDMTNPTTDSSKPYTSAQYVAAGGIAAYTVCQSVCFANYWCSNYNQDTVNPAIFPYPMPSPEYYIAERYNTTGDPAWLDEYISQGATNVIATGTATISGTTLTVVTKSGTGIIGGAGIGDFGNQNGAQVIFGTGIPNFVFILGQNTGTQGGAGTYTISSAPGTLTVPDLTVIGLAPNATYINTRINPNFSAAGTFYNVTVQNYESGWNAVPDAPGGDTPGSPGALVNTLRLACRSRVAFGTAFKGIWTDALAWPNFEAVCNFQFGSGPRSCWACWYNGIYNPTVPPMWTYMLTL